MWFVLRCSYLPKISLGTWFVLRCSYVYTKGRLWYLLVCIKMLLCTKDRSWNLVTLRCFYLPIGLGISEPFFFYKSGIKRVVSMAKLNLAVNTNMSKYLTSDDV